MTSNKIVELDFDFVVVCVEGDSCVLSLINSGATFSVLIGLWF